MTTRQPTLESRFRRLLRFYPRRYRAERGEEIVSTYMDCAPPDRRKPSLADVGDIAASGVRQRLRHSPEGLPDGRRRAAVLSLAVTVGISAAMVFRLAAVVLAPPPNMTIIEPLFTWRSAPWMLIEVLWIVVGVAAAFATGRTTRRLATVSLVWTAVVVVLGVFDAAELPNPYLWVPQTAFGLFALAWPLRPRRISRRLPLVAIPAGIVISFAADPLSRYLTNALPNPEMGSAAVTLTLLAVLVIGAGLAAKWWTAGVLMVPASLAAILPVASVLPPPSGPLALVVVGLACAVVGAAAVVIGFVRAGRRQELTGR
ncbi:MAG TPA: hypothetical protein VE172_15960 [Stackebrandtia sp.]|jgi:hypothetical protein|uniref:hypothetical protein n=1 Tax=Stackebrandtia sp. TaxID=2023065 RepID=UPI002D268C2F|nr:hypothetical protein [Stackebrandtia sp.]HZE40300.1 hypothetical protein [Stackebrandtia sp.]